MHRPTGSPFPRKSGTGTRRRPDASAPSMTDRAEFVFDTPQPAVTPGQAVVFYDEDVVVGGGWIE